MKHWCWIGFALITCSCVQNGQQAGSKMLDELIAKSARGGALRDGDEPRLSEMRLSPGEIQSAEQYIKTHRDYTSYHLLFVLRKEAPQVYQQLSDSIKASIMCSALAHVTCVNDWSSLGPTLDHDCEAGRALIETGPAALPFLEPLLDNHDSAPMFGSEEATMSRIYHYRRADFAYRYICLIQGWKPVFHEDPKERDKEIERLKKKLKA